MDPIKSMTIMIRELVDYYHYYYPQPLKELKKYSLMNTQVYPHGKLFFESLELGLIKNLSSLPLEENTKYGSIGTCFAEEFSTYLKENSEIGKYITLEDNPWSSSVFWGRVYTTGNLLQIINYSIQKNYPIHVEKSSVGYLDPLRDRSLPTFESLEKLKSSVKDHRRNSLKLFKIVDVLVITLGQNETWFDHKLEIAWGAIPPSTIRKIVENRFVPIEYDYQENLNNLDQIISKLKTINPNLKIMLTVSPVPAYATFLGESVISKSFASKCILRSVVDKIVNEYKNDVFYFPSFEMVLGYNSSSFISDNRHVKKSRVNKIFKIFEKIVKSR